MRFTTISGDQLAVSFSECISVPYLAIFETCVSDHEIGLHVTHASASTKVPCWTPSSNNLGPLATPKLSLKKTYRYDDDDDDDDDDGGGGGDDDGDDDYYYDYYILLIMIIIIITYINDDNI